MRLRYCSQVSLSAWRLVRARAAGHRWTESCRDQRRRLCGGDEFLRQTDGVPRGAFVSRGGWNACYSYFQISRDTFLEVMQATPARPAGCPHFGLEVQNLDAMIEQLKQRGVGAASLSPRTGTRIGAGILDHINMELLEMGRLTAAQGD